MSNLTIFGAIANATRQKSVLAPVSNRGWYPLISEPYSGAWQCNDSWSAETVLAYHAVFACITLIAADIGKLRFKLMQEDADGIESETSSPSFSPVLRKANRFQTHIQFKEWWIMSKLMKGNTYALKQRDNRGIVTNLYILDPNRTTTLVADDGSVYYDLKQDNLGNVPQTSVIVPASEIIHDRMNCLFHPLVGISPLFACGAAANQGLSLQTDATRFIGNGARPGGVITVPGAPNPENLALIKSSWETGYTGENAGKVALLGDGMTFTPLRMTAVEAQIFEQMKWTAEVVCSTFHVPGYMIGAGTAPAYNNIEALSQQYYSQCLQSLIESMELCLDEGLSLPLNYSTQLDLDGLLRMDQATQIETLGNGIAKGLLTPNGARKKINEPSLDGGDTVYMQEQNYSLAALAKRDARPDPFANSSAAKAKPATPELPAPAAQAEPPPKMIESDYFAKAMESFTLELAA